MLPSQISSINKILIKPILLDIIDYFNVKVVFFMAKKKETPHLDKWLRTFKSVGTTAGKVAVQTQIGRASCRERV